MRKIIQIAFEITGSVDSSWNHDRDASIVDGVTESTMYALCDDGTIWYYEEEEWVRYRVPPIPQD